MSSVKLYQLGLKVRIILHTFLRSNAMEQTPFCEANRCSVSQGTPCILWNPKVHYRMHKPATSPYPEPDQSSPRPHSNFWKFILILSSHLRLGLQSGVFSSGLPTKILYVHFLSPIRTVCPAHVIIPDLITWLIFGKDYRSQSSLLHSLRLFYVTSHFLRPQYLIS